MHQSQGRFVRWNPSATTRHANEQRDRRDLVVGERECEKYLLSAVKAEPLGDTVGHGPTPIVKQRFNHPHAGHHPEGPMAAQRFPQ